MLQAMRQNMKVILWITVIFFVLLIFLVWGADLQFGSGPQPNVTGLVNGEPVSASTYQQLLAINRQDAQAQGRDLQPSDELRIAEDTWNTLINEMLLKQEAARRGLQARDAEVRAILLNDPPTLITQNPSFQNAEGRFDMAAYRAFLQNPATPEAILVQLESYVREGLPQQKLQQMVLSGAKIPEDELRRTYREEAETADVSYVLIDAAQATIDPAVTDEDVKAYYDAHRDEFKKPRTVDLFYYSVPRVPTAEDSAGLRKEMAEFADEARRAAVAEEEGTENLSDSELATLASTFSELPFTENGGLDSAYVTPERMSAPMREAVSGLAVGGISDPFEDAGFYRVVQVADRKEEDGGTAFQLRHLGLRIAPSDSTVSAVESEMESVRERARIQSLQEVLGPDAKKAEGVVRGGLVPGLTGLPMAADFAHANPTGTVSRVLSTNTAWTILEVGEVHPPGVRPLQAVHDRVVDALLDARRQEAARAAADRVVQGVRGGQTLEAAAAAAELTVTEAANVTRRGGVVGLGRDAKVLAAAFTLPPGEVSGPLDSARGVVVLRVNSRPELDWTTYESRKQFLMQIQRSTRQSEILNAFLEGLRRKAEIVDYRT